MDLIETKWYQQLIEDCQAIVVEHEFTAKWALISGYHELGTRIRLEYKRLDKLRLPDKDFIAMIATSIGRSPRTVYYAVQFAREYPDLDKFPEGKNINWFQICNKYLSGDSKDSKVKQIAKAENYTMDDVLKFLDKYIKQWSTSNFVEQRNYAKAFRIVREKFFGSMGFGKE